MLETAAPIQSPISEIPTNPLATDPTNSQGSEDQLKEAIEAFKNTGQVDQGVIAFAKEQVLPKRGLSPEQISELGPVAVMVKLQEASSPQNPKPIPIPQKTEPAKTPAIEKPIDLNSLPALSGNVEELTDSLSAQIDLEIKRQMTEKNSLEQAQKKVDQVVKEHEELNKPEPKSEPTVEPKPKIGLFQNQTPRPAQLLGPTTEESENTSPTDPLTASVNFAIKSLKEDDKIGEEWTLKKILSTTFGNNKSPFYELVNKSGASWTLSPEEMKDVVRSSILSNNVSTVNEVKEIKDPPLHVVLPRTESKLEVSQKTEHHFEPKKEDSNKELKHFDKPQAEHHFEAKPEEQPKPKFEPKETEKPKHEFEPLKPPGEQKVETSTSTSGETKLSQKQIDFINKIHADPIQWRNFVSFSAEQWTNVHHLYEEGKLIDIGIDAHPLIDRLTDSEFGELVDIHKGDTANKLLERAGYNLSWTSDDAAIFGSHIIANHKLLEFGLKKLEVSGISAEPLPSTKDIIDLVVSSENGNHEATRKLQESLQIIPFNNKFKIIKPQQLEALRKYFKN